MSNIISFVIMTIDNIHVCLTHISMATYLLEIGRCGATVFAKRNFIAETNKILKSHLKFLNESRLEQMIAMCKSICHKWVKMRLKLCYPATERTSL